MTPDNMTAAAIALAFNTQNQRKVWTARANSRDNMERVHFATTTGMVKLIYDARERTFIVQFNKVQAAWGDYVRSIVRSLHVVLSTLKSAGLPFEAPDDDDAGIVIRTAASGVITVAYEPPQTLATAVMPEQFKSDRKLAMSAALGMGYSRPTMATDEHYDLSDTYARFAASLAPDGLPMGEDIPVEYDTPLGDETLADPPSEK